MSHCDFFDLGQKVFASGLTQGTGQAGTPVLLQKDRYKLCQLENQQKLITAELYFFKSLIYLSIYA